MFDCKMIIDADVVIQAREVLSWLSFSLSKMSLPLIFMPATILLIGCNDSDTGDRDSENTSQSVTWILDNTSQIGGYQPEVHGNPARVSDPQMGEVLSFNGESDGLIIPVNPVENWEQFTVEVLFKPASGGPEAQRFVHFQDEETNRGLIETRVTPEGTWTLDTYLHQGLTGEGHTLIDHSIQHPGDTWYWVALTYDGTTMKHFVNGVEELSGEFEFNPMGPGKISLGVRQNLVFWYEGLMKEIRFHPEALESQRLQKTS